MNVSTAWKNRIIGTEEVSPDQLLANPSNYRRHPIKQQKAMEAILDRVGWVQDVIVNKETGHVVDGHMRVEIAMRKGEESIPVKYVSLTEDEERQILATFDPISGLAYMDRDLLAEMVQGTDLSDERFDDLLRELIPEDFAFSPTLDPVSGGLGVTEDDIDRAQSKDETFLAENPNTVEGKVRATCPYCGKDFHVRH